MKTNVGFESQTGMIRRMTASESRRGGAFWLLAAPKASDGCLPDDGMAAIRSGAGMVMIADARRPPCLPPALPGEIRSADATADPAGYLLRRRAARAVASQYLGCPAEEITVRQTPAGSPSLPGTGLFLSFSGRGPYSLIGIGAKPVGVDIERLTEESEIPWNMLRPAERMALQAFPPAERGLAFSRLWAAKEAYAKALGHGFRLEPETLVITEAGDASHIPDQKQTPLPKAGVELKNLPDQAVTSFVMAFALLSS